MSGSMQKRRSRAVSFTRAKVLRAVKAAEDAGMTDPVVRLYPDGSIELRRSTGNETSETAKTPLASWDDM
jgi:hypothetical protein